jgi:hypothetical protein
MHHPFRLAAAWLITLSIGGPVLAKADQAPPAQAFDAAEQSRLQKLIEGAADLSSRRFDPQKLIVAVNALQALGQEHADAVLDEYLRTRTGPRTLAVLGGVPLIARALFEPREEGGVMPRLKVGAPTPTPSDPKQFPRFPLMIVDDVPLLVVRGYTLAGAPEPAEADLANIRQTCRFRTEPLKPTTNLAKLAADASTQAALLDDEQLTLDVGNQVLRLTASVYEPRKRVDDGRIMFRDFDAWWSAVREDLTPLKVTWDAKNCTYTK